MLFVSVSETNTHRNDTATGMPRRSGTGEAGEANHSKRNRSAVGDSPPESLQGTASAYRLPAESGTTMMDGDREDSTMMMNASRVMDLHREAGSIRVSSLPGINQPGHALADQIQKKSPCLIGGTVTSWNHAIISP